MGTNVLAQKYRPRKFSEVIGQDTAIKQIQSALLKQTLGHSLIFSGTRGCGKTTTARILASFLNCEKVYPAGHKISGDSNTPQRNVRSHHRPPETDEPCGECQACLMIANFAHTAVLELDAATNNGIDEVRQIQESLRYSILGHRVVILDEAHMLSKSASNSLLKTLEEPPPGVTFILLTTEPNKLIATVRSRCQLYEFTDVPVETLQAHYLDVSEKEGLDLSAEAAQSIALKAEGSVRDGLTLLQKYLAGEEVVDNSKQYFELVGAIYSGDVTTALDLVGEIRKAEEAKTIIQTLEKWFYFCSLEFFGQKTPIRPFFPADALQQFDLSKLQDLFSKCLDIERDLYATPNSKVVLEMGIIRLAL